MSKNVTFEIAKLLKEKNFDEQCVNFYTKPNSKMFGFDEHNRTYPMKNTAKKLYNILYHAVLNAENVIYAPIISDAVDWLLEKHKIWIGVYMENNEDDKISFYYSITENVKGEVYFRYRFSDFNSPREAYLSAIEYTLKNLI